MFEALIANSCVSVGDADFGVGLHEGVGLAVEGEAVDAVADGEHEHRGRAVDREARRHLVAPRLQERGLVRLAHLAVGRLRAAQDREDGADRDVDVDVGRAVERVEQQQVLAARVVRRDRPRLLHLLGGERGEVAAPFVRLEQDLVRQHVELLLRLALHVLGGRASPRPSASAPLFTRVLIALQARAMVSISRRRSALIRLRSRWRETRNWERVTRLMARDST